MIKPASSLCNMRCRYCFYEDVSSLRQQSSFGIMTAETRRSILEHTFSQLAPKDSLTIVFQGGEPTLAGLDWFEQFVRETISLADPKVSVSYALQTNGLLLDEAWFSFLKKEHFLIGLSLDGPRNLHDACRLDTSGKGTFSRILTVKKGLERSQIPYNALMVLTNTMARHPRQIWNFLQKESIAYVQFVPCLGPLENGTTPYALTPERYADFYTQLFDLWYPETLKGHFQSIKLFDDLLNLLVRREETACGITGTCHGQLIVEADGSVYPCDFYALDPWHLGNLKQDTLKAVYESSKMSAFRSRPKTLPTACSSCPYTSICGGGCPRMRQEVFCSQKSGFCGHRALLNAIFPRLQTLAASLTT